VLLTKQRSNFGEVIAVEGGQLRSAHALTDPLGVPFHPLC